MTRNILRGEVTLDTYKNTGRNSKPNSPCDILVCIPDQATGPCSTAQNGVNTFTMNSHVFHVPRDKRLYDLGWSTNLNNIGPRALFRSKVANQT